MKHSRSITLIVIALFASPCRAHLPSSSTLTMDLTDGTSECTWTVSLSVLDDAFILDVDADGKISAAEWRSAEETVRREVAAGLVVMAGETKLPLTVREITLDRTTPSPGVTVKISWRNESGGVPFRITGNLLTGVDPLHRVILRVTKDGRTQTRVLHDGSRTADLP